MILHGSFRRNRSGARDFSFLAPRNMPTEYNDFQLIQMTLHGSFRRNHSGVRIFHFWRHAKCVKTQLLHIFQVELIAHDLKYIFVKRFRHSSPMFNATLVPLPLLCTRIDHHFLFQMIFLLAVHPRREWVGCRIQAIPPPPDPAPDRLKYLWLGYFQGFINCCV